MRRSIATGAFVIATLLGLAASHLFPIDRVFIGLWLTMIVAAATVFMPPRWRRQGSVAIAASTGLWVGACAATAGSGVGGLLSVAAPVHWLARHKFVIAVKVIGSWMIAIASLSMFVSLMPTPGYKSDHME